MATFLKRITPRRQTHERINEALKEVRKSVRGEFVRKIKDELDELTSGWSHKPSWRATYSDSGNTIEVKVVPVMNEAGKIFTYVDQGTGAYTIRPRRRRVLAFTGKSPKTRARSQRRGKVAPGQSVITKRVNHPGIQARKFIERRKVRLNRVFKEVVDAAFKRGLA